MTKKPTQPGTLKHFWKAQMRKGVLQSAARIVSKDPYLGVVCSPNQRQSVADTLTVMAGVIDAESAAEYRKGKRDGLGQK